MFFKKECNYTFNYDKEGFNVFFTNHRDCNEPIPGVPCNHFNDVDSCILWAAHFLFFEVEYGFKWEKIRIQRSNGLREMEFCTKDHLIEAMWFTLTDVNTDEEDCIEQNWYIFEIGTNREDIWHWFDKMHSKGVAWLMYAEEDLASTISSSRFFTDPILIKEMRDYGYIKNDMIPMSYFVAKEIVKTKIPVYLLNLDNTSVLASEESMKDGNLYGVKNGHYDLSLFPAKYLHYIIPNLITIESITYLLGDTISYHLHDAETNPEWFATNVQDVLMKCRSESDYQIADAMFKAITGMDIRSAVLIALSNKQD